MEGEGNGKRQPDRRESDEGMTREDRLGEEEESDGVANRKVMEP